MNNDEIILVKKKKYLEKNKRTLAPSDIRKFTNREIRDG